MLNTIAERKKIFTNGIAWNREEAGALKSRWDLKPDANIWDEISNTIGNRNIDKAFLDAYRGDEFSFPKLEKLVAKIKWELLNGIGFVVLRGMNSKLMTDNELRFFYLALCLSIGDLSTRYDRLYEVYDRGGDYTKQRIPVSQTKASTNFHTDSTSVDSFPDIIGLLCINQAEKGGDSLLASALEAHEQLRLKNPALLEALYKDFIRDVITPGDESSMEQLYRNRFPVFSDGKYTEGVSFRYMRYWIETGAAKAKQALSKTDVQALDYLDEVMNDEKFRLQLRLERGDILLVNNHTIAHNRTAYVDAKAPDKKRRLVRVWIHV